MRCDGKENIRDTESRVINIIIDRENINELDFDIII